MVLIKKIMDNYNAVTDPPVPPVEAGDETLEPRYFKLPFIGHYSTVVKLRLKQLLTLNCEKIDARFIFTSFKVGQYFSNKDRIPRDLQSYVV